MYNHTNPASLPDFKANDNRQNGAADRRQMVGELSAQVVTLIILVAFLIRLKKQLL